MRSDLGTRDAQILYLFKSIKSVVAADAHAFTQKIFPALLENDVGDFGAASGAVDELCALALRFGSHGTACGAKADAPAAGFGREMDFVMAKSDFVIKKAGVAACACVLDCVAALLFKFADVRTKQCVEALIYLAETHDCAIFDGLSAKFGAKGDVALELLLVKLRLISDGRICADACTCRAGDCAAEKENAPENAKAPLRAAPSRESVRAAAKSAILAFPRADWQSARFVLKNAIEFVRIAPDAELFLLVAELAQTHAQLFLGSAPGLRAEALRPDVDFVLRRMAARSAHRAQALACLGKDSAGDLFAAWLAESGEEAQKSKCFRFFIEKNAATVAAFLFLWDAGDKAALVACLDEIFAVHAFCEDVDAICAALQSLRVSPAAADAREDAPTAGAALCACVLHAAHNFPAALVAELRVLQRVDAATRKAAIAALLQQKWRDRKEFLTKVAESKSTFTPAELEMVAVLKSDKVFLVREMAKELL